MREEIATPPHTSGLPFRVRMSGISYCDGSYCIRRTASPLTCLEYIIKGRGTVTVNGETFCARKGDIYILHEGTDHFYCSDSIDPWVKIWMNLSGTAVEHLMSAYGLAGVKHITGLNLETDFREFYDTAKNTTTATEVSDRCAILFHGILQKIATHLRTRGGASSPVAIKMKDMIDSTKGYDITLDEISKQLFFTKTHLIRVFRDEYNMTPYEYILSRKLRLAKDLLINTSLSISEISAYLNFCDAHYFSNFFRAKTGITPKEFRKRDQAR